ncbi:TonB-linked outer membrane protein, SusC/RagA family [Parapedobacter indicus]|uniref:TonB-linked outer membrane protein, SusC/RagA family n=2 Tax=Parapedobacter indicus TaxID=1477437 RepID=A0A1I3CGY2_9SPHI|nr:TonB-linked SusC/RagA family outer membrane protein [Parapedobacter indicus]SFH73469.1 TonB-linked outer membrane protein, SusC/RagA family [Parapedobacter indicus]
MHNNYYLKFPMLWETKFCRIMRLSLLLMLVGLFSAHASVYSQNAKFSIDIEDLAMRDALRQVEKVSGKRFFMSDDLAAMDTRVSVKARNKSFEQVMRQMLKGHYLSYQIADNGIVIITEDGVPPQDISVTGTVTDEFGDPIPGVSVAVKGGTSGVVTDAFGKYVISVADEQAVIVFSYVGFTTVEQAVGSNKVINALLKADNQSLEEVVVVGYGTQKKVNLTGAVETVGSEVFENRSTTNVTQALQGAVPNLNISLEDGKPARSASFNVRGHTSIGQEGSALILIDGVEGDPSFLNPNDIESVTVLKDAASAAIYGARGSFGVVLITTKRAQKGRTTVTYSGNLSSRSLAKTPEFVTDAVTWVEHFRDSYYNRQGTVPTSINNNTQYYSDEWLERLRAWKASGEGPKTEILPNGNYEYYANVDWMGMLFKDQSFAQDHNLNISGGNEKADFYVSGRFYDFDGMYNFDPDTYRSYNLRAKGSLQAYPWLKITNNMEFSNNHYHMPYSAQGRSANIQRYIEVNAFPSLPMYNPDGSYTRGGAATLGAFADGNNYQNNNRNLFRNTVGFNTGFFDNAFRINGDFTFRYDNRDFFWKRVKVPYYQNANAESPSYMGDVNGVIYEWMGHTMYTASNLYAEYENTFAEQHYVKAMAGWNYETSAYKANSIERNQLLLEDAESIQLATGESIIPGASVTNWKTAGTFFRLNYGYRDRYLLEVNGRYDGSSRFPVDQQWGFFPSVSAGWRLSEEPFWNVSEKIFSDIKFRGSYGSLGNGNIAPYNFLELLSIGSSGRVLDGALNKKTSAPAPIPAGLTWEKATTSDIGLDFGMVQGKLRFSGDYYVRKTTDMYVAGPTLPDIFGATSPKGNFADMTTKGFEATLTWQDQFALGNKPFRYQVRGSLFDYVSTIDKFYNPTKRFTDHYAGKIIGELWGFETDGLFQSDPDPSEYINTIFNASADAVWRAGDLKIRNRDGSADNMITKGEQTVDNPGDMTIIGNTEPRYQYAFTLGGDWNGIFFSAFLQGVGKQDWYPGSETAFWGQYNRGYNQMPAWHLGNYWTEDHPDAYLPRYAQYNGTLGYSNHVPNDRYLQRVSYLRLRSLQIGYTLPQVWMSKIGIRNARIYATGENLASWSPLYKRAKNFMDVSSAIGDKDSDLNSSYNQGDGNSYPLLKTVSFGLSFTY